MADGTRSAPLPLMWGVFLFTQLVITGASFAVPPEPSLEPMIAYAFGVGGVAAASASVAAGFIPFGSNPQTRYIVRWAMAEGATILGFVSWFVTGERLVQFGCLGVSLAALVMAFPRPERP